MKVFEVCYEICYNVDIILNFYICMALESTKDVLRVKRVLTIVVIFALILMLALIEYGTPSLQQLFAERSASPRLSDVSSEENADDNANNSPDELSPADYAGTPQPNEEQLPEAPSEKLQGDSIDEELVEIRISFAGDCTIGTDETFTYVNSFPAAMKK